MKYQFLVLIIIFCCDTYAQSFEEHIINVETDGTASNNAVSVYAVDLDSDGHIDILSSAWGINNIAWYKNDGQGNFGSQQVITTNADGGNDVFAIDLDGDNDIDVLSASTDNKIAWYENNGSGSFGVQQIISNNASQANSVYGVDLDIDGMIDVLSASEYDDKIAWYKNEGQGNFSNERIISISADGASDVFAIDLDNDNDVDVLSASKDDGRIAWYQNNGAGIFSSPKNINTNAIGAMSVYAIDIDGDGDMDVISASSASFDEGLIAWYENDGLGGFSEMKIVSVAAHRPYAVHAADINGDGYVDVLSASDDGNVSWYMNTDGLGDFGEEHELAGVFSDHARDVFAIDVDGDNDTDILSATWLDDKIVWYENEQVTATIFENSTLSFRVFPNPVKDKFTVISNEEIAQIKIFNQLGSLLISDIDPVGVNMSNLSRGIYIMKVEYSNGFSQVQIILKQ